MRLGYQRNLTVNEFENMDNVWSFESMQSSLGIEPVNLFCDKYNSEDIPVSLPSSVGNIPLSEFKLNLSSSCMRVNIPTSVGRVP